MSWNEEFSQAEYQHYWNLAAAARQHLLQETPSEAVRALLLYQQGQKCLEQQDVNRAIAYFAESLALRPLWHSVWTEQAALLLRVGEPEAAIEACDRALEITPDDAQTWSLRGAALLRLKRYGMAISSCDRAVSLDPQAHLAWRTLSEAQNRLGRYSEAVLSYDKALALQPDDPPAWGDRGRALQKLGQYEAAVISYDKLLVAEPQHPKLWYARGLALRKLGRMESAIASFQQALELQPSFYPATRSKLVLLLTCGQGRYLKAADRATLRNDLNNVLDSFTKTKLPGLMTIALVALASTHSPPIALSVAALFLLIAIVSDLLTEFQR